MIWSQGTNKEEALLKEAAICNLISRELLLSILSHSKIGALGCIRLSTAFNVLVIFSAEQMG